MPTLHKAKKPVVTVTVDGVIIKAGDWFFEPSCDGGSLVIRRKGMPGHVEITTDDDHRQWVRVWSDGKHPKMKKGMTHHFSELVEVENGQEIKS